MLPFSRATLNWILAALFAVLAVLDFQDGSWPKILSSFALFGAFLLLALYQRYRLPAMRWAAATLLGVSLASIAFRVVNWFLYT